MPYTKTVWQDGITVGNQTHMNNLESIFDEAMQSFNPDLFAPFVESGLVASRHNSYASNVLASTPLRYYRLDEPSGSAYAFDSGSNGQTGVITGGVTANVTGLLTGDSDAAMTFNGTTGYVSIPTTSLPTGASAWTIEAWVKPTSGTAGGVVCSFGDAGSAGRSVTLAQLSSGGWQVFAWGGTVVSGGTSAAGAVHHVVATFDGTNLRLYVDGALVAGPTAPGVTVNISGAHAQIGAMWNASYGSFFGGTVDEVAIYGAALSAATITAHYTAGTTATTQVDMTSGVVVPVQSDSTTRHRSISSASFTTVTPSTTYYLYAQPDGTTYWSTANTPAANSLAIAQVTTDGSGNVKVVTDVRTLTSTMLPNATAGVFPRVVAQALNQLITTTAPVTVLTYTPTVTGHYRISAYLAVHNINGTPTVMLEVFYDDPYIGPGQNLYLIGQSGAGGVKTLSGNNSNDANAAVAPVLIYNAAGHAIQVIYQDTVATPNDVLSVIIERIA